MRPSYYNELPITSMDNETALAVAVVLLGVLGVILIFALAFWIMRSIALHTIARRRGIRHAWLSWIPIGCYWILGSLSDQYQHLMCSKITSRRKIVLLLALVGTALSVVNGVLSGVTSVLEVAGDPAAGLSLGLLSMLLSVATFGVGIAALVFYHMCNYDLYRSCDPKNAVVFLVIGIFIPVTEPFFYLACRKKDRGFVSIEIPEQKPD